MNVLEAAYDRLVRHYRAGDRIVVSFSGGKDSGICLELASMAAEETGRLPVDVVMQDEEIMIPGTFEYCEKVYNRSDLDFHWIITTQPNINIFNREMPYWWTFDPAVGSDKWVRQPPSFAEYPEVNDITNMTTKENFPIKDGQKLLAVVGIRATESRSRNLAIYGAENSYLTKPNQYGTYNMYPIYEWTNADVWKFYKDTGTPYNSVYDVLHKMGIDKNRLRIAPPTMVPNGLPLLQASSKAFPRWFDKVCERLPGVRSAAMFGKRAVEPQRMLGESWEECFQRTCIDKAPQWIGERSVQVRDGILAYHSRHSTLPFPQLSPCPRCERTGSWKKLAMSMYYGDPFGTRQEILKRYVPSEFFRPDIGTSAQFRGLVK